MNTRNKTPLSVTLAAAACVVLFVGVIFLISSCGTVSQSDVGFQVGGGQLDPAKNKVKSDLLRPGRHILGIADSVWTFPSNHTLRFLDFKQRVTTIDGKGVVVSGQVAFRFVGEKDPQSAREFAEGIGARKYRYCDSDGCTSERAGEGDKGWTGMLNQLAMPEVRATLKDSFGRVYCADFEPACRAIDPRKDVPVSSPESVYGNASKALQQRFDAKLGAPYLQDVRVRVQDIDLPSEVQSNIDAVTAEQAKTKAAQQSEQTAKAEAAAINTKGKALKANPQSIAIEVAKECHGGDRCTIIIDGSGRGVSPSVRAGR